jgi:hypothetical protein
VYIGYKDAFISGVMNVSTLAANAALYTDAQHVTRLYIQLYLLEAAWLWIMLYYKGYSVLG